MPLKPSVGNMYPWVTHTHTHLGGECSHKCVYCYVDNPRFGRPKRYCGPLRLIEQEFNVKYGSGKTIFIENCNDLFAEDVPPAFISRVKAHGARWPDNTYVFQTKNPARYKLCTFRDQDILGTTIETNRDTSAFSDAPPTYQRMEAMACLKHRRKFVTIEPVLDFDVDELAQWIDWIHPEFLNLGADSKNHNLPEPTVAKIHALVAKLKEYGIELREKHNLKRLKR